MSSSKDLWALALRRCQLVARLHTVDCKLVEANRQYNQLLLKRLLGNQRWRRRKTPSEPGPLPLPATCYGHTLVTGLVGGVPRWYCQDCGTVVETVGGSTDPPEPAQDAPGSTNVVEVGQ